MSRLKEFKSLIEDIKNDSEPNLSTNELLFRKNLMLQIQLMFEDFKSSFGDDFKSNFKEVLTEFEKKVDNTVKTQIGEHEKNFHFKPKDTPSNGIKRPPEINPVVLLLTSNNFWKFFATVVGSGGVGAGLVQLFKTMG